MDPLSLATAVTTFLTPLLPFLVKGGEAVAEEVSKDTWSKAKAAWSKLFPTSEDKNRMAALKTAEAVAAVPDSEALKTVWREELKKLFEADSTLANEVASLMSLDKSNQDSGDSVQVQVFGNRNKAIGQVRGQDVDIKM